MKTCHRTPSTANHRTGAPYHHQRGPCGDGTERTLVQDISHPSKSNLLKAHELKFLPIRLYPLLPSAIPWKSDKTSDAPLIKH
ncbi:hypothetical protein Nepgr_018433 [Nepenthes gracilis]|uniref:Uncharacterized protein n=1 Tax=Nepenthes gracilis TaxID=150966 RepID=A0AAD3SU14_NEPGR|nr:hypothetical protein Nepgr_018433 [Nepenthes gracilis]